MQCLRKEEEGEEGEEEEEGVMRGFINNTSALSVAVAMANSAHSLTALPLSVG